MKQSGHLNPSEEAGTGCPVISKYGGVGRRQQQQWAESSNLSLIHDAKLPKSFTSARWKKGYNPDLIFASISIGNMCEKSILDPIPHTQHHPICVTVKPVIVPQPSPFRRRFNLRKADKSIKILMKLMPHQNATRSLSELYVWRPENIYIYEMNMH